MSTSQRQTAGTSVRSHPQSSGGLRPVVNAVSIQATRVSSERNLENPEGFPGTASVAQAVVDPLA